jgi:hypothetical protein
VPERGAVVLGEVIGVEPRPLVALEQLQALLELPPDCEPRLVDVVEDAELTLPPVPRVAWLRRPNAAST